MKRSSALYADFSERFSNMKMEFNHQYCQLYATRLKAMRGPLLDRIRAKWGDEFPVYELHKLAEESYEKCVVIGTLYKEQKLKPSVLRQLAESVQVAPHAICVYNYCSPSDTLFVEDELQRYVLVGPLKADAVVTGVTCALLGTDNGKGKFMVADYCFADCRPQVERPILEDDVYVVFVSGLHLLHAEKTELQLQLLLNWLAGVTSAINNVEAAKIMRLIIAGNSVRDTIKKLRTVVTLTSRKEESDEVIRAVKTLDTLLAYLCQIMNVDVMPGENDPSNLVLPQKPMHYCLFSNSHQYKSLNRVSNPYECEISRVKLIGSSGQPVTSIRQYSEIESPIDALEKCLVWNHLAPTAPDTLASFPFYEGDPFILKECPHVLFAGNQDRFETRIYKGPEDQYVRLICVPRFSETHTACVLNLKNLDCFPIKFDCHQ